MKTEEDMRIHQRLMSNGRVWYCTPKKIREEWGIAQPTLALAMMKAEMYYINHTTESTRAGDMEESAKRLGGKPQ